MPFIRRQAAKIASRPSTADPTIDLPIRILIVLLEEHRAVCDGFARLVAAHQQTIEQLTSAGYTVTAGEDAQVDIARVLDQLEARRAEVEKRRAAVEELLEALGVLGGGVRPPA